MRKILLSVTVLSALAGGTAYAAPVVAAGDVISSATSAYPQGDADARQIVYRTRDAQGAPIDVSGMVLVPRGSGDKTPPLVGWAPGTHGIGDDCAPSRQLAAGNDYEASAINALLSRGFAVAVTDYQGLGTPGDHTYVNGRAQGQAVLDAIRAAQSLLGEGPVAIMGYSQGGQSASWAAELQPTYAPAVDLRGVSIGAAAGDLKRIAAFVDGKAGFGFGLAAAVGLKAAYPELPTNFFTPEGQALFEDMRDDCTLGIATKYGFKTWAGITTSDPFVLPSWSSRLDEQLPGLRQPAAPVRLYHSTLDDVIPHDVGTGLRVRLCATGASVDWQSYSSPTHIGTFYWANSDSVNWVADRFAGLPARDNCE
ncbi:alpha/beta fold hydrolase [Lentzea tibetensis]|uniref:Alpha/beta fold hydrolase n=1 Tax=Lentzea tibetensis TaxID=2591470 RepID=A0A563ER86_9PSEU|nr:lipase family protein [Lentzea tibetensis]TWP50196.1 alpha/beta fold hydrolase [Lentzea tibetensis]